MLSIFSAGGGGSSGGRGGQEDHLHHLVSARYVCPHCHQTVYLPEIASAAVSLRCARCGHTMPLIVSQPLPAFSSFPPGMPPYRNGVAIFSSELDASMLPPELQTILENDSFMFRDNQSTLPESARDFTPEDIVSTFDTVEKEEDLDLTTPNCNEHAVMTEGEETEVASTSATAAPRVKECMICLEKLFNSNGGSVPSTPGVPNSAPSGVVRIYCGHSFHEDCITRWVRGHHYKCPLCRRPMIYTSNE